MSTTPPPLPPPVELYDVSKLLLPWWVDVLGVVGLVVLAVLLSRP